MGKSFMYAVEHTQSLVIDSLTCKWYNVRAAKARAEVTPSTIDDSAVCAECAHAKVINDHMCKCMCGRNGCSGMRVTFEERFCQYFERKENIC